MINIIFTSIFANPYTEIHSASYGSCVITSQWKITMHSWFSLFYQFQFKLDFSALALLKMVMHARSGGNLEVMGLLLGKVDANVMVVMDSFALPVEGTETRVNAQAQGYEYMTAYIEAAKQVRNSQDILQMLKTFKFMYMLWYITVNSINKTCSVSMFIQTS